MQAPKGVCLPLAVRQMKTKERGEELCCCMGKDSTNNLPLIVREDLR